MAAAAALAAFLAAGKAATAGGAAWPGFDGQPLDVKVGGVVAVVPRFEGSKSYVVRGVPFAYPTFIGGDDDSKFQVKGVDDLRYRLISVSGFEAGPLAGWRFGRQEDDASHLSGLGDVDGGLIVGGYAGYHFGALMPYVSYHHQVTGDDSGGQLRFGVEMKQHLSPRLALSAKVGATWASQEYMASFFGVTATQAANSGLAQFSASSGVKDSFVSLTADVKLDERWDLKVFGQYSRLLDDAADSPITETANQFVGGAALTYRFTIGR